jgi:hypothetical protein
MLRGFLTGFRFSGFYKRREGRWLTLLVPISLARIRRGKLRRATTS